MNKHIKPTDMRKLNALVRDEDEAAKDYAHMSKQFEDMGNMKLSKIFAIMSDEEAGHRDNIIHLIDLIKKSISNNDKIY